LAERSKLWYLKNINLFHGMSEEQMRMVEQRTVMREVRRREVLYLPGDAGDRIYLLKRGVVKISALQEDGREVLLALLRKGEVFGEEAVLDDSPRDHVAEAYEDALVCIITRQDFMDMLRSHPELVFKVTKLIGLRLKTFRTRVEHLLFKGRLNASPRPCWSWLTNTESPMRRACSFPSGSASRTSRTSSA